jgi:hypothetical protein
MIMNLDTVLSIQMNNYNIFMSGHYVQVLFNDNSCHKNVQQASKDEGKEK